MSSPITYIGNAIETIKGSSLEPMANQFFEPEQVAGFRQVFSFLNDKDRDILYLFFVSRKKQMDVKRIIGRSQPSLCYDIKKIRHRLKYIFYIFSNFDIYLDFLETKAHEILTPQEICVLTSLMYTSSFTLSSDITGFSQVKIRYTFKTCIDKLKENKIWDMYELFTTISDNQNSLKRIHKCDTNRFFSIC